MIVRNKNSFALVLIRGIADLIRVAAYCAFIVFLLNFIFDVSLNEVIPIDAFGILWVGVALFIISLIVQLGLMRDDVIS